MREILFRAKRIDTGEWAEGLPGYNTYDGDITEIETRDYGFIMIDPETICQYTGLTDKNGRKIFEGDIIRDIFEPSIIGVVKYGEYRNTFNDDELGGHAGFYIEWKAKAELLRKDLMYWTKRSEVIGNIFDNPERLEGGCKNEH